MRGQGLVQRAIARAGGRGWRWGMLMAAMDAAGPDMTREAASRHLNWQSSLDDKPDHLGPFGFEDMAFLFSNGSHNYSIVSLTVGEAALLFRETRRAQPTAIVEIGRYKGGGAILLAAAAPDAKVWTVDNQEKEARLAGRARSYDEQLASFLADAGLANVEILNGDSRTIEIEGGPFDVVFVDGDHSYDGCRIDIERFGMRLRQGGSLFLHDVRPETADSVSRAMNEAVASGAFRHVRTVGTLAQLERV